MTGYKELIKKIQEGKLLSLDTETISLSDKTLVSFSICIDGAPFFIPVRMNTMDNEQHYKEILSTLMKKEGIIFHNFSFDSQVLRKEGFIYTNKPHDTLAIAHLLNENESHKLADLVRKYIGYEMTPIKQLIGMGKKQINFSAVQEDDATQYGLDDARYTYHLFNILIKHLQQKDDLQRCYETIERPLLLVVDDMHSQGVPIDINKVQQIQAMCQQQADDYYERLQFYMEGVNLNSPLQLRQYFIDKKFMPILKRSRRTGEPSVDSEVLEKYKDRCVEAGYILKYRYYTKILTTFLNALLPQHNNRIFPHFNQLGTTSGRFSSSEPNGQNFPKTKDELGLRSCIRVPEGYKLVVYDYAGIELRIISALSGETKLIHAFNNDLDIHSEVAKEVGCSRNDAKTLSYALLYGAGVNLIAKMLNCNIQEAHQHIYNYYKKYPNIRTYLSEMRRRAYKQGYLSIYGGRRRHISANFEKKSEWERGGELRSMVNATIQGSASILLKKAMIQIHNKITPLNAHIIMTIHDELMVLASEDVAEQVAKIVAEEMVNAGKDFNVKISVDGGIGDTWDVIH